MNVLTGRSAGVVPAPRYGRIATRILITYVPLVILLTFLLAPFYWMIITAFKPDSELYSSAVSPLIVWHPTLVQFEQLFSLTPYLEWAGNSIVVSSLSTGVALLFGLPAGYAMARLRFRGSGAVGMAIFGTYLVPATLLFIPMYQVILSLGLLDTKWALVVVYPTFLTPFCTWLMSGYFKTIPKELEECARVDGSSRFGAMWRIAIPLAKPGIVSAGIFAFTASWNEFLYALTLVSDVDQKTLPLGVVATLMNFDAYPWGSLMAGALLGSIPIAIIYSFFVENYAVGLTAGAVKG
ncbi:MAG TPA: carbohydrate ABC transporter permease [Chloroflexota bacterium]|nr:carbohydrate ABC transporter permease [Chloroflexota bacterium]